MCACRPESFPKAHRILSRRDYERARQQGTRHANRYLALTVLRRGDDDPPRLGTVATKRFGRAVVRNRAKRRAREAFRRRTHQLPAGVDLVVFFRGAAADCDNHTFQQAFESLLKQACVLHET